MDSNEKSVSFRIYSSPRQHWDTDTVSKYKETCIYLLHCYMSFYSIIKAVVRKAYGQ